MATNVTNNIYAGTAFIKTQYTFKENIQRTNSFKENIYILFPRRNYFVCLGTKKNFRFQKRFFKHAKEKHIFMLKR